MADDLRAALRERTERTIRALLEMHAEVEAERDAARADLVALLEGMEQVGWRKVHQTDDGPVDDLCPMSKYRTDYPGAGYAPVYRLSPSAASLHAGLTGAVTGPSAPAAPIAPLPPPQEMPQPATPTMNLLAPESLGLFERWKKRTDG